MKLSKLSSSLISVLAAGALVTAMGAPAAATDTVVGAGHRGVHWTGTWATAVQPAYGGDTNWSSQGFEDHSVRQVFRISRGGSELRIRLSNTYGERPLRLTGATVGKAAEGAAIEPGTLRRLTFDGRPSTVVPAGQEMVSDRKRFLTAALDRLAVTLYFARPTGSATFHQVARATVHRADGDHRFDTGAGAFDEASQSSYFLSALEVTGPASGAVVAFGDSITDGSGSTPNADNRYPDKLAERLTDAGMELGVLNTGIAGNRVLHDSPCYGERATARFERDVLDRAGVRTVIVLEGINDIGFSELGPGGCREPTEHITARELIEGHRVLIDAAHERGLRVIGGTLTPYEGAVYFSERGEAVRDAVNDWIRHSGEYDAVVDFDKAVRDPANPDALLPKYDSGDHLHLSDTGYHAMAQAIDLDTLVPAAQVGERQSDRQVSAG